MAKCLRNGLNYPFYYVSVWKWIEEKRKEDGGEYWPITILETEDEGEAMSMAKSVTISPDTPQVNIRLETYDGVEDVGVIDESGFYKP